MDRKREEIYNVMHFSIETHTQNMGQDNNSQTENAHNTTRVTLGQWIGKEK